MAKKKNPEPYPVNAAETASGIMRRMKLRKIWLCSDGEWFTTMDLALAHVDGNPELTLTTFKH